MSKTIALSVLFPEIDSGYTDRYSADKLGYIWSNRQTKFKRLALQMPGRPETAFTNLNKPAGYKGKVAITSTHRISKAEVLNRLQLQKSLQPTQQKSPVTISAKGFIVGSVTVNGLSFAASPKIHANSIFARAEVERLAKAFPGGTFAYLEIIGNCTSSEVSWS